MREKRCGDCVNYENGACETGIRVLECLVYVLLLMTQRAQTFLKILQTKTNLSMQ